MVEDMADDTQLDKKEQKKAEKARKKAEKKAKKEAGDDGTEELEESGGSKIAVVFVTLIIIILWLAILALLVKWDVGGFGSTVLTPVLKDVPYINKILPDTGEEEQITSTSDEGEYAYQTLDEAIARIKELELQLQESQQNTTDKDAYVAQLEAEVERLSSYETAEADFEEEKAKFYEEVVFADNAPDISQYKNYYESIDPANAEKLYKQVVQQTQTDEELQNYIKTYSEMKPKQAAAIFDTMTDNLKLVAKILENMDSSASASILGAMNSDTAAKVTEIMEPSE